MEDVCLAGKTPRKRQPWSCRAACVDTQHNAKCAPARSELLQLDLHPTEAAETNPCDNQRQALDLIVARDTTKEFSRRVIR